MEHNVTMSEHGANASIKYLTCSCGWESKPIRGRDRANRLAIEHRLRAPA